MMYFATRACEPHLNYKHADNTLIAKVQVYIKQNGCLKDELTLVSVMRRPLTEVITMTPTRMKDTC